tara:strand:- start:1276 stop:1551 length:276 start_codon:yes stop_codon:yes gene_type:complete
LSAKPLSGVVAAGPFPLPNDPALQPASNAALSRALQRDDEFPLADHAYHGTASDLCACHSDGFLQNQFQIQSSHLPPMTCEVDFNDNPLFF